MRRVGGDRVPGGWSDELAQLFRRLKMTSGVDPVSGKPPSLRQIARRAGYSPSHVRDVINGIGRPSPEAVAAVAGALNATGEDQRLAVFYAEQLQRSPTQRRDPRPVERPRTRPIPRRLSPGVSGFAGRDAEPAHRDDDPLADSTSRAGGRGGVSHGPAPETAPWAAAIHASDSDWQPWGAGVVIDDHRVLTCAHVLKNMPSDSVWVAFPKAEGVLGRRRVATVMRVKGVPDTVADVAVLVLDQAVPAGVTPAALRDPPADGLRGRAWWAFGFPNRDVFGSAVQGVVDQALTYGWARLRSSPERVVGPGFSGGGLWSPAYEAVVGLIGQAHGAGDHTGDGRVLTLRQVATWLPDLDMAALARWSPSAAGEAALAAWGWSLADDPEAGRHWSPRARGVGIDSEQGFRFRGRSAALQDIIGWLLRTVPDRRVLVVSGSPGVGKSAVLGRIVITADAGIRAVLPPDDPNVKSPLGLIACAVHAKGKTALEVAVEIARAASIPLPEQVEDLSPALRAGLRDRASSGPRFNVVIDALDEADSPDQARLIVAGIVLPLVQTCSSVGVQVVVGTRQHDDDGDLLAAFGPSAQVVDLDSPQYFAEDDLVGYSLATLQLSGDERPTNPYADPAVAAPVARRIAHLAEGNFLVAGLVARARGLYDRVAVTATALAFAPSVESALRFYLDRLSPVGGVSAAAVLTVLAFAEAPGLPIGLWHSGLQAFGISIGQSDLARFARSAAANFLVETGIAAGPGEHDVRCYRLFHQALNDTLRGARTQVQELAADERMLAEAWAENGRRAGWAGAPAYLLRSLANHAVAGGVIDELLLDDDYLCYVDLLRLIPNGENAATEAGRQRARMLYLTPHAVHAGPMLRAAMFQLTTVLEHLSPAFPALASAPYEALWAAVAPRTERNTFTGHTGGVQAVCAVPVGDGRHWLASASDDETVRVWDPVAGQLIHTLTGHAGRAHAVCAVPVGDGRYWLASASDDETVRVWDPVAGRLVHTLTGHVDWVRAVCAVPVDGGRELLVSAGDDETVRVWDPVAGQLIHTITGHVRAVRAVCAVPVGDGRYWLASASDDETVRVCDPLAGQPVHAFTGHTGGVRAVCAVPLGDGRYWLASASSDETVRLWDAVTGQLVHTLTGHTDWVRAVCTVPLGDGRYWLASAGDDQTVRLWDPVTGQLLRTFTGHTGRIQALSAVPVGGGRYQLASVSYDQTARIWDPLAGQLVHTLTGHTNWVQAVCALPVGNGSHWLATASHDQTVRLWQPLSTSGDHPVAGPTGRVRAVCAVPVRGGQHWLASTSDDQTVRVWDPVVGRLVHALAGHTGRVRAVCAVPVRGGQHWLASTSDDQTVRVWDPMAGQLVHTLTGHTDWVHAVCAVPLGDDRHLLASASYDQTVRVWDPDTGGLLHTLTGHTDEVRAVCVVPIEDGRHWLASAGEDQTVRIWDPVAGQLVHTLTGHTGAVQAVCAMRAGDTRHWVATAGDDATVRLWEPATGRSLLTVHTHHAATCCLAMSTAVAVGLSAGILGLHIHGTTAPR